jgi:hypothetical protein
MGKDITVLKLLAELFSSMLKTRINGTTKFHNISFDRNYSGNVSVTEPVQLL